MSLLARFCLRDMSASLSNIVSGKQVASRALAPRLRAHSSTSVPISPSASTAHSQGKPLQERPHKPRLSLTFTCTASGCSHRSTHQFAKASYERGVVLVQCPACKNRHLIADHLGWFKELEGTAGGTLRTIEDLMRAKGEKVIRGELDAQGTIEYLDE